MMERKNLADKMARGVSNFFKDQVFVLLIFLLVFNFIDFSSKFYDSPCLLWI